MVTGLLLGIWAAMMSGAINQYQNEKEAAYNVDIEIFANDRSGLLADIITQIGTTKSRNPKMKAWENIN